MPRKRKSWTINKGVGGKEGTRRLLRRLRRPCLAKPTSKLRLMMIHKVTTKTRVAILTLPSCRMKLKAVPC